MGTNWSFGKSHLEKGLLKSVDLAKKNNFLLQVVPTTRGSIIVLGWLDTNITGESVGILFTCWGDILLKKVYTPANETNFMSL